MKRLTATIMLVLLGTLPVFSQKYGYVFLPGWIGLHVDETEYGYKTYGLNKIPGSGYTLEICNYDSMLNLMARKNHHFDSTHTTVASPYAFDALYDDLNTVTAIKYDTVNGWHGLLTAFTTDDSLIWQKTVFVDDKSYPLQTYFSDTSNWHCFGNYQNGDNGLRSFFQRKSESNVSVVKYQCTGFSQYGGCNLFFNHAVPTPDSGYLIAADVGVRSALYAGELQNCLIIKTDSQGKEIWRKTIYSTKHSYFDLHIAPLKNGNYLAVWADRYYKPYMSPSKNQWAVYNDSATFLFAEFDMNGKIIREWNIYEKMKTVGTTYGRILPYISKVTHDKDSTILVGGWSGSINSEGFLLKLDGGNGELIWYRDYKINIAEPHSGYESLKIEDVTRLEKGYALIGEYKSGPSDSFPQGVQKGVLLLTDEKGCQIEGCDTLVSVQESIESPEIPFSIYPNPSSGEFTINALLAGDSNSYHVTIYDYQGNAIKHLDFKGSCSIRLSARGVYFIRITSDNNTFHTKRIIIQ